MKDFKMNYNYTAELNMGNKLLLHVCCAPCALGVVKRLNGFSVTPYFYNANIDCANEYNCRANEVRRVFAKPLSEKIFGDVQLNEPIICDYTPDDFCKTIVGTEFAKEGGARCEKCIGMRIFSTAKYAVQNGYDYFCSVLSVSPHKNAQLINKLGLQAEKEYNVKYLANDFKKNNGFFLSTSLSKQFGVYRQHYCGCKFSNIKADNL